MLVLLTPADALLKKTLKVPFARHAMPRLRSQTGFTGILPPELVERCVEYLPFEEVHTTVGGTERYGQFHILAPGVGQR